MQNLKSMHVIDQGDVTGMIHLVGCGALGSLIAMNLFRVNLAPKMVCYDFDEVEDVNVNNQAYFEEHVGLFKTTALAKIANQVDSSVLLQVKDGRVEDMSYLQAGDVLFLAIDDVAARAKILRSLEDPNVLVISGGISSIGGNIEVVRGLDAYEKLASEYDEMDPTEEYSVDDLSPCGSPISIYHRISNIASFACEEFLLDRATEGPVFRNVCYDLPNRIVLEVA